MSWILIKQPHPLDRFWTLILEQHEEACDAHNALPEDAPEEVRSEASAAQLAAVHAMMALPARNLDDVIMKLMASGIEEGDCFVGCNPRAILNEATAILDAALMRGRKLQADIPDLLEGVKL